MAPGCRLCLAVDSWLELDHLRNHRGTHGCIDLISTVCCIADDAACLLSKRHRNTRSIMQAGRRKGDRAIGRFLADTVDAVPLVSREDLEVLFNDNVQVLLLSIVMQWSYSTSCTESIAHHHCSSCSAYRLRTPVQDVLLVMYLANLVRAHVSLADKLGTASIPLL